jgi:hypothetical protein
VTMNREPKKQSKLKTPERFSVLPGSWRRALEGRHYTTLWVSSSMSQTNRKLIGENLASFCGMGA